MQIFLNGESQETTCQNLLQLIQELSLEGKRFAVEMNEMILKYLPIDEIRFCPHSNMDECDCRKPKPGMILGLADKWNIDCQNSFLIGDSCKDIEAGKKVGVTTFLLKRHYNKGANADHKVTDLSEAVKIIQNIHRNRQA